MDSSPAGLPGLPLKERRNEIQLTLARHIMDPRGKTQGTVPAPASPSSICIIQPLCRSGAGQTQKGLGLVALRPFASALEGLHDRKDAEGPSARSPLTAQMISALPRARQGWSLQPAPLGITSGCQVGQGQCQCPLCPHCPCPVPAWPTIRSAACSTPEHAAKRQQLLPAGPDRRF